MRLLHGLAKIHATFDDPNLVSRAGLVPVMALAQRAGDGSLPSGREIADQFGRHERWGRMVKRSGTARELSSGHSELALRLVEQQSSPAAGE